MTPLKYHRGPAGHGKTHAVQEEAIYAASMGYKVKIVVPSILLISQIERDLKHKLRERGLEIRIPVTPIHDTRDRKPAKRHAQPTKTVFSRYLEHVEGARYGEGEILLVTRETFRKKGSLRKAGWMVMFDEENPVVEHLQVPMNRTHSTITDHLDVEPIQGSKTHVEVVRRRGSKAALTEVYRNEDRDGGWAIFGPLLGYLLDPNCKVVTTREIWNNLRGGKMKGHNTDFCCLTGPRMFEGYQDVNITCALFEHTMQFKVWTRVFGASMVENVSMDQRMRRRERYHTNSAQFTILGAYDEPWYDYAKRVEAADGFNRLSFMAEGIQAEFGDQPYAHCANNDDHPLPSAPNITDPGLSNRLGAMPHGLNGAYEAYTNIALLGSYNYNSFMALALTELGITEEEQEVSRNFLTWYQQMMRFGGRDPSKPGQYVVIAPTTRFGQWLKETGLFPRCTLGRLPYTNKPIPRLKGPGRPKVEKTPEQKEVSRIKRNERDRLKYHDKKNKKESPHEQGDDHHRGGGAGGLPAADFRHQAVPSRAPAVHGAAVEPGTGPQPLPERHRRQAGDCAQDARPVQVAQGVARSAA